MELSSFFLRGIYPEERAGLVRVGLILAVAVTAVLAMETTALGKSSERRLSAADFEILNEQVIELYNAGKISEAIPLAERALKAVAERFNENHPNYGTALNNLALLYKYQGRYSEAEPLYRRALAISETAWPEDHPDVAISLNNLAVLYEEQGRYGEAEPLYKRALAINEKALPRGHPDIATSLNNLAGLYRSQGRYGEAEPLMKRSLSMRERALPASHPEVATSLNILAVLYEEQGRYGEAEPLMKRALAMREKVLPAGHPEIAASLGNLAVLYEEQGRYGEAEPLYKRALAIKKKALPAGHPDIAKSLNNLAELYESQGRYGEAEPLYRSALEILEKARPAGHLDIAGALNNLAVLYESQGRYGEAEALYKRAQAMTEKALPLGHPDVATSLNNLAELYRSQGRYDESEALYKRALAMVKNALPEDHPNIAASLGNLGWLYLSREDWPQALSYFRQAATSLIAHARVGRSNNSPVSSGRDVGAREIASNAGLFRAFLAAASHIDANDPKLRDESFEMAQLAVRTEAAGALTHMAARQAASSGPLSEAVRSLQDAQFQWEAADKQLSKVLGEGNKAMAGATREKMTRLEARMREFDDRLVRDFPKYAELALGQPASIADAQSILRPDEALVAFTFGGDEVYLFVVRKDVAKFVTLTIKRNDIAQLVAELRDSLDPKRRSFGKMPPFDAVKAHELYQKVFGPVDGVIRDAAQLIIVADGPLQSLPPSLLVTEAPKEPIASPKDYRRYRDIAWLIRRQAVTLIPSVSSLVSLRKYAQTRQASEPFVGFGDPDLGRCGEEQIRGARIAQNRGIELKSLFRGAAANQEGLRALGPLCDTADELRAEARLLGAPKTSVYLRKNATVTKVKSLDLSDRRVVAFATHGLVAGDLPKLAEPALALTPPPVPRQDDDGLLRASEVSQLKLNADWVLLSACNTAAADGRLGAEGLSGLAKAFFYAGARSLLVSHWSIDSAATVQLMTDAFSTLENDPTLGRSEAFRRAMLKMIDTADRSADTANRAHPTFWAPFAVVGEGTR